MSKTDNKELAAALNEIRELREEAERRATRQSEREAKYFVIKDATRSARTVNSLSETMKHFEVKQSDLARQLAETYNDSNAMIITEFNNIIADIVAQHFADK